MADDLVEEKSTLRLSVDKEIAGDMADNGEGREQYDTNPYDETAWRTESSKPYWHYLFDDVNKDLVMANLSTLDKTKAEFSLSVAYQIQEAYSHKFQLTKTIVDNEGNERSISEGYVPRVCFEILHDVAVICAAGRGFLGSQWDFWNTKTVRKEHKIREENNEPKSFMDMLKGRRKQ